MKKTLLTVTLLACLGATSALAQQKMVVAVEKFENKANAASELFTTLRTRITDEIINTRKFEVVEREQIKSVLSEQNLRAAGVTAGDDGPDEGKMKSAGYVLYGSVLSLGLDAATVQTADVGAAKATAKVEIQLRISNAENGKILASKTVVATKSQARATSGGVARSSNFDEQSINDAIRAAAKQVTDALIELAYPVKIIQVGRQDITLNMTKEQVEVDDLFDVYGLGEMLIDPDTKEELGQDEELVGRIQITTPGPKMSKAKPVGKAKLEDFEPGMLVRRVDAAALAREKADQKKATQGKFESRF